MSDEQKTKITDAKAVSKVGMILGAILIIGYNLGYLLFTQTIPSIEEQKSILLFGGSILIMFSPIYLGIIMDKVVDIFKK